MTTPPTFQEPQGSEGLSDLPEVTQLVMNVPGALSQNWKLIWLPCPTPLHHHVARQVRPCRPPILGWAGLSNTPVELMVCMGTAPSCSFKMGGRDRKQNRRPS